jgi:hypothetical protein
METFFTGQGSLLHIAETVYLAAPNRTETVPSGVGLAHIEEVLDVTHNLVARKQLISSQGQPKVLVN